MARQSQDRQEEATILVRGARQLLTLRGAIGARRGAALRDLGVIPNGALLIRGRKILQAGPDSRVENLAVGRRAREIDAAGRLVMPGFVDCNADLILPHPPLAAYEQSLSERPPGEQITSAEEFWRAAHEIRATPARRMEQRARQVASGMVRHGTTTIGTASGQGLDRSVAVKVLRVLARLDGQPARVISTYYGARFPPPAFRENRGAYLDWICADVLPAIARRKLAQRVAVNLGADGFPANLAHAYLERARQLGFAALVHAGDNTAAVREAIGMNAGVVSLHAVNEPEATALAGSRTTALLSPAAVRGRRETQPLGRALIDAGAAVALASGFGSEGSPTYNMQVAISLACSEMGMSPAEALSAATVNAAHALGLAEETGTLEPGKNADLILCNVQDYREIAYHFGVNHVHMVMKDGVISYQEGGMAHWPER